MKRIALLSLLGFGGLAALAFIFLDVPIPRTPATVAKITPVPQAPLPIVDQPQAPQESDLTLANVLAERDPARRQKLLQAWAASVELKDMETILSAIERMPDAAIQMEVRHALLASWTGRDFKGVASWFGQDVSPDQMNTRIEARGLLVEALGKMEPEAALNWMNTSLSPKAWDLLSEPFFRQWAGTDPKAACARLSQFAADPQEDPQPWNNLLKHVIGQWSAADARAAVAWLQTLPEGQVKTEAMQEVSYRWAATAPQEAATYAAHQNDPALMDAVVGQWAGLSPQAAASWVKGLPSGEARAGAIARVADIWAQNDPTAAALYAASIPSGEEKDRAVVAVAGVWALVSPEKTAAWVNQLPEGTARGQALIRLMSAWAGADPQEAGQWLQTLPNSPSNDLAIGAYSDALSPAFPATAFAWADTISTESVRNEHLQHIATSWLEMDASTAQKTISQSNLPDILKAQLLHPR